MKVLQVVQAYWPSKGGSQYLAQQVAEHLVSDFGDEVTVFTTVAVQSNFVRGGESLPPGVEQINGVTVERFPVQRKWRLLREGIASLTYRLRLPGNDYWRTLHQGPIVPGLAQRVATSGAQVIFANPFPLRHMFDALHGAKRSHTPLVYLGALHMNDRWGYDRAMIYDAIRQADAYIAHTPPEAEYVIARGADPRKVHVIAAGVDLASFAHADPEAMRAKLGLGSDPTIIVMATHSKRKRIDLLLQAMPVIWQKVPTTRLLLAGGRSSYTAALEAMIAAMPADSRSRITLITDFPEADKASLLAASDLLVLPSAEESFGIVLVEAWAAGKPVIGAGVGAVAALINDGVDGYHYEYPQVASLAAKCISLVTNPAQAQAMGQAGLAKAQAKYAWTQAVAQIREVMRRSIINNF